MGIGEKNEMLMVGKKLSFFTSGQERFCDDLRLSGFQGGLFGTY